MAARWWSALVVLALAGCVGVVELPGSDGSEDDPPGVDDPPPGGGPAHVPSSTTRRLSTRELSRTLDALTGIRPDAIGRLPPESRGFTYARVVNGQTVSRAHLEGHLAIAEEVTARLLADGALDRLSDACPAEILAPSTPPTIATISGVGLSGAPEWAFGPSEDVPTRLSSIYAPDPIVFYTHGFEAAGRYRIAYDVVTDRAVGRVELVVDDAVAHTAAAESGAQTLEATVEIDEPGPHLLELRVFSGDDNLHIHFDRLVVEGPEDPTAGRFEAERRACAQGIVDDFAPRAFRRPIDDAERARLSALFDEGAERGFTDGIRMLLSGILATPSFLYLVERGAPVEGAPGAFALGPWELSARLSYALCAAPPDDALREAAASGAILEPETLEAHARRLLDAPCGRETVQRFLLEWLWLDHLEDLNKSPDAFPEFDEDVRAGMLAESRTFVDEMVWGEGADLPALFGADHAWPDPRSGFLWGIDGADGSRATLPPERAGILTSPGVLSVTASFDGTSPVHRGVYVLEQVLCDELPPPPMNVEIVPPPPDPDLTTRERWAAHSSIAQCRSCHERIDPVGFAFEGFDGIGRFRTMENGHPVDSRGGLPLIGLEDGTLDGGAALSRAVADSDRLGECFADQWLRFSLGRLTGEADAEDLSRVAERARADSVSEALVTLVTSQTFRRRYEEDR